MERKLILANGTEFIGSGFGAEGEVIAELVFNTSMVGYQEIITDPSYTDQMVIMTYPLIGNYGITDEDNESKMISISGMIIREYNDKPSNFRYTKTLAEVLEEANVVGITRIDTRMLTRIIRNEGSMLALITDETTTLEEGLEKIRNYKVPHNQVEKVTCKKKWYSRTSNPEFSVVAIDSGIKYNIVRSLNAKGCNVTIVPTSITYEEIMEMKPDGVFLSNGPGDPEDNQSVIELIKKLQGNIPLFGICLGHQMIALANGLKTYKLKFGHRGGNHPVRNLENGRVEITSQNHSYAVDSNSNCNPDLTFTHINVLDNTVEGLKIEKDYAFSVQYHPESAPGPQDSIYLFDQFIELMKKWRENHNA